MPAKRGRKKSGTTSEVEIESPAWQELCSEDTLIQWQKLKNVENQIMRARERIGEDLFRSWHYQVVVSWFYKVCESFVTINYGGDVETFKPFWRDVKFDEELLLQELSGLAGELALWESLRWHILKNVANNKGVSLKDWDELAQHYLKDRGEIRFGDFSLEDQFKEIYAMIRVIERKNLPFRNYLLSNLELFEPVVYENDGDSLYALANVGVLVRRLVRQGLHDIHVPLKLKNCTVRVPYTNGFELVGLDYSVQIDEYLQSVKVDYELITYNWDTFAQCVESKQSGGPTPDVDYEDLVNVYVEHQLYSRRLLQQRQKEQEMAELLTRRKRSSRLVAREEEVRRKDLESEWLDRLDSRDQFLRLRNRLVNKNIKKIKDWLWSQLWSNFEKDLRITRTIPKLQDDGSELSGDDLQVLAQGTRYTNWICEKLEPPAPQDVARTEADDHPLELPLNCAITQEDVERGVAQEADNQKWLFKCVGEPHLSNILIGSSEEEQEHSALFAQKGGSLVCCDSCLRWQHWECQPQQLLSLLAACQGKDALCTARDFGIVQVGHAPVQASRRSSRRAAAAAAVSNDHSDVGSSSSNVGSHYLRPTDKRKPIGQTGIFICAWCCCELERELREKFPVELSALRAKQRKGREERERRRQAAINGASRIITSNSPPVVDSSFATDMHQQTSGSVNSATNTNRAAQLSDKTASAAQ